MHNTTRHLVAIACLLMGLLAQAPTLARTIDCPNPDPDQPQNCPDNWGLDMIDERIINGLDGAYLNGFTGEGVLAYIVDSGFELDDEFLDGSGTGYRVSLDCQCTGSGASRQCTGGCFFLSGDSSGDCTPNRHGTRTASILGGRTFGVAPGVTLLPAKNAETDQPFAYGPLCGTFDFVNERRCVGNETQTALLWVLEDYQARKAQASGPVPAVVNVSLSLQTLIPAGRVTELNLLAQEGMTVVVSAGNSNQDTSTLFAGAGLDPSILVIGAVDRYGKRWKRRPTDPNFCLLCPMPEPEENCPEAGSNYGSGIDLWAPGEYIRSAEGAGAPQDSRVNSPLPAGTSFAAPFVAGAAALFLETNPAATPQEVKDALIANSTSGVLEDLRGSPNRLLFVGPPTVPAPRAVFELSCNQLSCTFDGSDSYAVGGASIVSYEWLFGDGTSTLTTVPTASHNYLASGDYTVILRVYDDLNRGGSYLETASVEDPQDDPPVALFSYVCTGSSGTRCLFDAGRSSDDNGIVQYHWDFGDGYTGYGLTKQHNFFSTAARNVKLTVTDAAGQSHQYTRAFFAGTTFDAPYASLVLSGCEGLRCKLDGSASSDDQGIHYYIWKPGDGSTKHGQTVREHLYAAPGTYTATLRVLDAQFGEDTAAVTFELDGQVGDPPVAAFTFDCSGMSCDFDASGAWDDVHIRRYQWSFGDGTTSTAKAPSHAFGAAGTYAVELTVEDLALQSHSITKMVVVPAP